MKHDCDSKYSTYVTPSRPTSIDIQQILVVALCMNSI